MPPMQPGDCIRMKPVSLGIVSRQYIDDFRSSRTPPSPNMGKMGFLDSGGIMATETLKLLDLVADLPQMPASDVKRRGWRGVMRTLTSQGPVLVTNHSEPEAVIVSAQEYVRLLTIVRETETKTASGLETLRHRFDE